MRQISYTIATKLESVDTEFEFIVTDLWILDENSAGIYYLRWQVNMKLVRIGINSGIELSVKDLIDWPGNIELLFLYTLNLLIFNILDLYCDKIRVVYY